MTSGPAAALVRATGRLVGLAAVGSAILAVPTLVLGRALPREPGEHWLPFEVVYDGYNDAWSGRTTLVVVPLLLAAGFAVGALSPPGRWLRAAALLAFLPVGSLVDGILHGDHNLLGIEWFLYAVSAVPAVLAALVGSLVAARRRRGTAGT